jgi:hypothetical protein
MTQLEEELVKQWNAVTRTECVNLIESMPERIRLCLKASDAHGVSFCDTKNFKNFTNPNFFLYR